jgi:hypothetical protein
MDIRLSREVSRVRLRDIIIGSAIAATLVAMMPADETGRSVVLASPSLPKARAPRTLLPKPKPTCADTPRAHDDTKHCVTHASTEVLRTYSAYGQDTSRRIEPGRYIDIRI